MKTGQSVWPLSVFVLNLSPALAEGDQDPSANHNEICETCGFGINSVYPFIPQTRSWDVWTRQDHCPSSTGLEHQWDKDQA